jgi:ABC-2 type transport system ATP-binding protein
MSGPAVLAEHLCLEIEGRRVVDDVSLAVAAGEIFGIVGADGAGKSSLLRLLTGQCTPASGDLRVLGLSARDPALRERIAYMPQAFGQYLDLTVRENLLFYAALHGLRGREARDTAASLVARAGLQGFEDRRAGQLSGGMMQKLALACALVSRPAAMFLDEPTTGVDPLSRRSFWQLLEAVRAQGVAVLVATANMAEAERCDRLARMERGRFLQVGRALDFIAAVPSRLFAVEAAAARSIVPALRQLAGVELAFPVGRQVRVWLRAGAAPAAVEDHLRAQGQGGRMVPVAPDLHDVTLRELALAQAEAAHA